MTVVVTTVNGSTTFQNLPQNIVNKLITMHSTMLEECPHVVDRVKFVVKD